MNNNNDTETIASLVLGIVSIVVAVAFGHYWFIGAVCGVVGIVLGINARKSNPGSMATAGFVCSIVGLVLCCLSLVCVTLLGVATCGLLGALL